MKLKLMDRRHFVYRIENKLTQKSYVGKRSSKIFDVGVNYFTSSSDKNFKNDFMSNTDNYYIHKLGEFDTSKEALEVEIMFHNMYNVAKSEDFYNKAKQTSTGWDTTGVPKPAGHQVGEKNSMYGKPGVWAYRTDHPMLGKHLSDKTKKKISQATKGLKKSEETKQKMSDNHADVSGENNPMWGKTHSDESKLKISDALIGRVFTCDHKKNLSEAKTGVKQSTEHTQAIIDGCNRGEDHCYYGKSRDVSVKEKISKTLTGSKWMHDNIGGKSKLIKKSDIEEFLKNKWIFGKI